MLNLLLLKEAQYYFRVTTCLQHEEDAHAVIFIFGELKRTSMIMWPDLTTWALYLIGGTNIW